MVLEDRHWKHDVAVVVVLAVVSLVGAAAVESTIASLKAVEFQIFPPTGAVPTNVKFVIAINTPRLLRESNQAPLLGPGSGIWLGLTDVDGGVVELKISPGPAGLLEAVPKAPLRPNQSYRLRIDGDSELARDLALEAKGAAWRIRAEADTSPPVWSASPTVEGARLATRDCFDFTDCETIRELDFMVPVTDDGGRILLLWSDASLDGSTPPRHFHVPLLGRSQLRTLCCFSAGDHLVRFVARDAAGNSAAPTVLAFGD